MSRKSKKALLPVYAQAIVVLDMFFSQRHAIDMLKSNHGVGVGICAYRMSWAAVDEVAEVDKVRKEKLRGTKFKCVVSAKLFRRR
jgi:hypothetical protein